MKNSSERKEDKQRLNMMDGCAKICFIKDCSWLMLKFSILGGF